MTRLASIRPLVRYVDSDLAIVEFHVDIHWPEAVHLAPEDGLVLELVTRDPQGQSTIFHKRLSGVQGEGRVRFELPDPQLWWPAGMGEQALYDMTVRLLVADEPAEALATTMGMASVRPIDAGGVASLLVHGQPCAIQNVFQLQPMDENAILPVGGKSLLVVRQHFGTPTLYEAADRAGILLIQSIPFEAARMAHESPAMLARQISSLTAHPSLAGWLVDKAGRFARQITDTLHKLDPTRTIFQQLPGIG